MKAIDDNGSIIQRPTIPINWKLTDGYNLLPTQDHYNDGWRDVVNPSYNPQTEKLGEIYFDEANDVFTYQVETMPDEEIKSIVFAKSESDKQTKLTALAEARIVTSMQEETDEDVLLDNASIFPIWEAYMTLSLNEKIQAWDNNELKLYRTVQAHVTQDGWEPPITPALFTRVGYADEILDWAQPTGSQDAYQIDDKVTHAGKTWISIAANNVWEPGVYGWNEI